MEKIIKHLPRNIRTIYELNINDLNKSFIINESKKRKVFGHILNIPNQDIFKELYSNSELLNLVKYNTITNIKLDFYPIEPLENDLIMIKMEYDFHFYKEIFHLKDLTKNNVRYMIYDDHKLYKNYN